MVKSIASPNLEVKKLVYIYLVHYAEKYALMRTLATGMHIFQFLKLVVELDCLRRGFALYTFCLAFQEGQRKLSWLFYFFTQASR